MPDPNRNLHPGECVGVVYWHNGKWRVHDGVLKQHIADGNHPPNSVAIVHYLVDQSTGKLHREDNRVIKNVHQVLRTPSYPTFALKCPHTLHPDLHVGHCVVVKLHADKSKFPSGFDAKNGVLVCSLEHRLQPGGKVWINHWKIVDPTKPRAFLETRHYPNAVIVREVK